MCIMNDAGVSGIEGYNALVKRARNEKCARRPRMLPRVAVIISELSELMWTAPIEVENAITSVAPLAQRAGVHLVIGTRFITSDILTGKIEKHIPCRAAIGAAPAIESRVILGKPNAKTLTGCGETLLRNQPYSTPVYAQGCRFDEDAAVEALTFLRSLGGPQYDWNAW